MSDDRTIFGSGRYPDTGLLAVLARVLFMFGMIAIVVAVFLPSSVVPKFIHSSHLEHFAAFYLAITVGMAAMPRTQVRKLTVAFLVFGTLLEVSHLPSGAAPYPLVQNWVSDVGGIAAAILPIVVQRFRTRFPARA